MLSRSSTPPSPTQNTRRGLAGRWRSTSPCIQLCTCKYPTDDTTKYVRSHELVDCSYFGVRALKIQTPRPVAKFITTIQIVQFVISCYIFADLVVIKTYNQIPDCAVSWNVLSIGGLMYLSYLYLFAEFFYNAYIKKRSPTKSTKSQ
ncbi:hypothetical protein Y032_0043g768 [Ancylostoma ceylanicum]|uniref:Elongation of very long chain fatty acids protein n=1 Tax=Ancylostoma ceylanicum TaxID=53326 RepID=A0A016UDZ8_9BILA|nr:hypothetical protein Y032_0043g768 [Ancylostoma ceylanicum]